MSRKIVAGNWKMNTTLPEATDLARALRERLEQESDVETVLIPPFPWIVPVVLELEGTDIRAGVQNCYTEPSGAYTGEVSAEMFADICEYIIVGHSERRHVLGETDEFVAAKVQAVMRAGLRPILCVGETLEERDAERAYDVVASQLSSGLGGIEPQSPEEFVIAYEPVWAIGTGRSASEDDAQGMAAFIRSALGERLGPEFAKEVRIQYGGSVNAENAVSLMACPDVDGALVGGASLKPDDFAAIVRAAASASN